MLGQWEEQRHLASCPQSGPEVIGAASLVSHLVKLKLFEDSARGAQTGQVMLCAQEADCTERRSQAFAKVTVERRLVSQIPALSRPMVTLHLPLLWPCLHPEETLLSLLHQGVLSADWGPSGLRQWGEMTNSFLCASLSARSTEGLGPRGLAASKGTRQARPPQHVVSAV